MDRGLDWYKRDPIRFLDGAEGMGPELIGAYAYLIDLIYARGGRSKRDDKALGGRMGCSTRKATALTNKLIDRQKIIVSGEFLTHKHAETDAENARNRRETNANSGRKGGEANAKRLRSSREKDVDPHDFNGLGEAVASSAKQADKSREDKKKKGTTYPKKSAGLPVSGGKGEKPKPTCRQILVEVASDEAVDSYLAFRQKRKQSTSSRVGNALAKQLTLVADRGGDPDDALLMAEMKGWQGFEAAWYFEQKGRTNGNGHRGDQGNNRPSTSSTCGHHDALMQGFARAAVKREGGSGSFGDDRGDIQPPGDGKGD